MSKTRNKMFMFAAGASLAGVMALSLAGCSNPVEDVFDNMNGDYESVAVEENPVTDTPAVNENESTAANAHTAQEELASPAPLTVSDYGWFASENSMVDFSVEIQNPNQHVAAHGVTLTVEGVDENGDTFFAENISLTDIAPDSEYVFSYVTGDTSDEAKLPADLTFTVSVADDGWYVDDTDTANYTVEGVTVSPSEIEGVNTIQGSVSADSDEPEQVMVNTVLYDSDGNMLGGYFDIVELNGTESEQFQTFLIDAPEYDSYQVFVSPYVFER